VLTVRKTSEIWFASLCRLAEKVGPTEFRRRIFGVEMPQQDKARHIAVYESHNQAVRDYFASRPDKLLVACWETGTGWAELCRSWDARFPTIRSPTST
jgi:hypothetical protein